MKKSVAGIILHNARENFSYSVVFTDGKNELWNDSKTAFKMFRDELEVRTKAYTKRTKQKLQKNTATSISAVVNLEQYHTLKDLEELRDYLEKEFGTKVFQMAIHRDEGKLINKKNPKVTLVSGKTFFLNPKNELLYHDKEFTNLVNLDEWTIEKNYHAHIEMMGIDEDGNSLRKKMNIYKLSKLQDFVAQSLNMERGNNNVLVDEDGKVKRKNTKTTKRKDPKELKEEALIKNELNLKSKKEKNKLIKQANEIINNEREEKKKLKEELEELKKANNLFREEIKTNEDLSTRENFKLQEDLNRQLQEDLKNKSIELDEALKQIEDLKEQMFHPEFKTPSGKRILNKDAADYLAETNQELEKRIKELERDLTQEHSISTPSYQQKILFEKYHHLVRADLKGFFIDTKGEETKILNKAKDINITDKGNALISHSNGTQNLEERVRLMLDLSEAKGWDLDKITIKGNDLFKNEIKKQINERLMLKELNSYKENLKALQAQNEQLASENITLNAKVVSNSNMSDLESLKEKNKELEKLLATSIDYTNIKLKEIRNTNGTQTYIPITEEKLKELSNAKEKRLNNESFENLNKTLNKFVGSKSAREENYGREV